MPWIAITNNTDLPGETSQRDIGFCTKNIRPNLEQPIFLGENMKKRKICKSLCIFLMGYKLSLINR